MVRASSPRPIIRVSAPRPLAARARRAATQIVSRAANAAREERHRVIACAAAGLVGYAEREGWHLPAIDMLGVPATYGLGLWLLQKSGYLRSKTLSHACTGLLSVAAYKFASGDTLLSLGSKKK